MKNKKTIMAVSALFIIIFHLWINITSSVIEMFLKQLCVIGVDLFFFISAYSISKQEKIEYKNFVLNRVGKVYFKFIILSLICAIYSKWNIIRFLKTVLGIELFIKGGGSFLWFIPAIMLVYLLLPLYKLIDDKHQKITPLVTVLVYLMLSIFISSYTDYNKLFILTNRIPIILIGFYFAKYKVIEYLNNDKVRYWLITFICLVVGLLISYTVYINHFRVSWFYDIFYILYILLEIGLILLLNKIKENRLTKIIGSVTLELYGLQMIFGFKLANEIYKCFNITLLSNISVIIILIILSLILEYMFNFKSVIMNIKMKNK